MQSVVSQSSATGTGAHIAAPEAVASTNINATPGATRTNPDSWIERMKHPTRGGQNLSERYHRLERSLRGKEALSSRLDGLSSSTLKLAPETSLSSPNLKTNEQQELMGRESDDGTNFFRGFRVPQEPKAPEADGGYSFLVLQCLLRLTFCC